MVKGMTEQEFTEAVAAELLAHLDAHRDIDNHQLANVTGYSVVTIKQFRSGAYRSIRLAARLVETIPELGAGLRSECCGRLPDIFYRLRDCI